MNPPASPASAQRPRPFLRRPALRFSYNLQKHEWVEKGGRMEDGIKAAKATEQEKTSLLLGKAVAELDWH